MPYDYIVVGGGAAGLAGAVFLTRLAPGCRVLVLEKQPRVGRKLLATGNGTCNLTNVTAAAAAYHGAPALAEQALKALTVAQTMDFFTAIGVDCVTRPDGRVYPASLQASSVLDALRYAAEAAGVCLLCEKPVDALIPAAGGWTVCVGDERYTAPRVLVTVGGAAAPSLGGGADGYRLLTDRGCERTPLFPSLVQLRTATEFVRAVKGIRVDAGVTLCLDGRALAHQSGEVLFTEYGLSGPAVMALSRHAADWERQKKGTLTAWLDLLPGWDTAALAARVAARRDLPGRSCEDLLTGLLHKRVGQTVLRVAGVLPLSRPVSGLTEAEVAAVAATVKDWSLPVIGTQGFGGAQVTAGGIAGSAVDAQTLECKRLPGVYLAGEVLDVDGDCGGFNLQFAWSSAYMAADAMARRR